MGQVIGKCTKMADVPATDPLGMDRLFATIFQTVVKPDLFQLEQGIPDQLKNLVVSLILTQRGKPLFV